MLYFYSNVDRFIENIPELVPKIKKINLIYENTS